MTHRNRLILLIATVFFFSSIAAAAEKNTDEELFSKAEAFYRQGRFEDAAQCWEQALSLLNMQKNTDRYADILMRLTEVYQALGYHSKALSALHKALPVMEKSSDPYRKALFFNMLGDIYLSLGDMADASEYLQAAEDEARAAEHPYILATVLNNMGNLLAADNDGQAAADVYDEALSLSDDAVSHSQTADGRENLSALKSKILLNIVFVLSKSGSYEDISAALTDAMSHIAMQPDLYDKSRNLLSLGNLMLSIRKEESLEKPPEADANLMKKALETFREAKRIAETLDHQALISYSCGYMGKLYEEAGQYADALNLTRQAIFFATAQKHPETLYLWQWQSARLFKAMGDNAQALKSYHSAIATLNPIRHALFSGYRSQKDNFNENIKPVYLELAGLLLEQAETLTSSEEKENRLREARDVMELLKTAELQNFFEDECLAALQSETTLLNRTEAHTAVLYPICLSDRLTLLLTLPDGMKSVTVSANAEMIRETAFRLLSRLQTRTTNQFFYDSWQLFDWLIRPVESLLSEHEIDTLIVVPDGALRLIPFSALHDGKQYLVEKYAVAAIPAVTLTDVKAMQTERGEILLAGISESVQGFPGLPEVSEELKTIQQMMNGKTLLQNKEYTLDSISREFKKNPYSIVHLATHGVFGGTQEESFLLTYDDKMTMNQLEDLIRLSRAHNRQVELLTLSACQTAQGDERAALGLAGVAVKAGVSAAVATLWYVDDEAAALLVREFYQELKTPGISKAKALQNAQKKMISQRRYRHPDYWAPFLLIGNWM
jgi:CHAT domain-containing protein/predicted negative regulator of RcsB-dependent stress response